MIKHANTYSAAFNAAKYDDYINGKIPQKELYKYSSFWYKNFDEMAFKTMLRYLISQWGIMSIEMQSAIDADNAVINESGEKSYVEIEDAVVEPQAPQSAESEQPTEAEQGEFDFFNEADE